MRRMVASAFTLAFLILSPPVHADDAVRLKMAHEILDTIQMADKLERLIPPFAAQLRLALIQRGTAEAGQADLVLERFQRRARDEVGRLIDEVASI